MPWKRRIIYGWSLEVVILPKLIHGIGINHGLSMQCLPIIHQKWRKTPRNILKLNWSTRPFPIPNKHVTSKINLYLISSATSWISTLQYVRYMYYKEFTPIWNVYIYINYDIWYVHDNMYIYTQLVGLHDSDFSKSILQILHGVVPPQLTWCTKPRRRFSMACNNSSSRAYPWHSTVT